MKESTNNLLLKLQMEFNQKSKEISDNGDNKLQELHENTINRITKSK